MRKLIIMALMCLMPLAMLAFNVYFYKNAVAEPITEVHDVQKIVFSTDGTTVTDNNGVSTTVALDDADYFAFNKTSGAANVSASHETKVTLSGATLLISSSELLNSVDIIAANGIYVGKHSVSGHQAAIDVNLRAGTYIVRVTNATSVSIKKIIVAE